MSTIVVGLDGSEGCVDALRFAIEEARAHGFGIRAVSAWHVPVMAYGAADGTAAFVQVPVEASDYEKLTAEALNRVLEQVDATAAGVEVTRVVREGHAAEVLLDEAKTADMLVVGSRGRGGFTGLLLGSVGHHVAHHARCPVVIVPQRERAD